MTNTKLFVTLASFATLAIGSAANAAQTEAAPFDQRKICLKDSITGSRIERTVCKTVAEWRAQLSAEEFETLRKLAGIATTLNLASASKP
jgi:predicted secreted protein